MCAVSLTHKLRLCKPHLARHKYIISRCLHWMQLKLESFSLETTCLHTTECARGCDVIACAAGNKRIRSDSARRETDRTVTDPGRSCEKSSDSDHWPVNRCISNKHLPKFAMRIIYKSAVVSTGVFLRVSAKIKAKKRTPSTFINVIVILLLFCKIKKTIMITTAPLIHLL